MAAPRKPRVLYVYHGTAGVAGAYAHAIASAMRRGGECDCALAVSAYYAFDETQNDVDVLPIFFRFSENTDRNPYLRCLTKSRLRLPIRYLELSVGYARALAYVARSGTEEVNLSVIDDELPTLAFAWLVKRMGRELAVTAHDVVFQGPRSSARRRRRVFQLADRVVVHYGHAKRELESRLGLAANKVIVHPFPWADAAPALHAARLEEHRRAFRDALAGFERVFLLPGILRKEKGLDTLLAAWRLAGFSPEEKCLLVIAGKPMPGFDVRSLVGSAPGVRLYDRYLTSEELVALLELAHVVVLPYSAEWYAHSSMVLMAQALGKPVIASDIPLFRGLVGASTGYLHAPGDSRALAKALRCAADETVDALSAKGRVASERVRQSWAELEAALRGVYAKRRSG